MEHLPPAVQNRIGVLLIAAAVDLVLGDPQRLWHPVQGIGTQILFLENALRKVFAVPPPGEKTVQRDPSFCRRERAAGTLMVLLVLTVSTGITLFLLWLCGRIHPVLRIAAEGILCGRLLAMRSLAEAGFAVRDPLLRGDVATARKAVSMIVGRDTQRLDAEGIAKAAVETVAENTSDGVTAPLFYMFLSGGAGGILYKAVNTMDSMTGYKNDRYRYFGTAAARLDDLMNFLPSRITAILMILACYLPGKTTVQVRNGPAGSVSQDPPALSGAADNRNRPALPGAADNRNRPALSGAADDRDAIYHTGSLTEVRIPDGAAAFRIWKRDRLKSPSPNSAQTESVCAGALHVHLLGDTWYFGQIHHKAQIGDGGRKVEPADITRAVRLMERTGVLLFFAGVVLLVTAGMLL